MVACRVLGVMACQVGSETGREDAGTRVGVVVSRLHWLYRLVMILQRPRVF